MKMVELGGFIIGVQRSYQGITGSLHGSIRNTDHQCGQEERPESIRENGEHDSDQVEEKGHFQ
jgi:hypothetical protein